MMHRLALWIRRPPGSMIYPVDFRHLLCSVHLFRRPPRSVHFFRSCKQRIKHYGNSEMRESPHRFFNEEFFSSCSKYTASSSFVGCNSRVRVAGKYRRFLHRCRHLEKGAVVRRDFRPPEGQKGGHFDRLLRRIDLVLSQAHRVLPGQPVCDVIASSHWLRFRNR